MTHILNHFGDIKSTFILALSNFKEFTLTSNHNFFSKKRSSFTMIAELFLGSKPWSREVCDLQRSHKATLFAL